MFNFLREVVDTAQAIASDTQDLISDSKKIVVETKNEIKGVIRDHNTTAGEAIDKIEKIAKTIGNVTEHLPQTDNPYKQPDVFKFLKEVTEDESDDFSRGGHLKVNRVGYSHHAIYLGNGRVVHYQNGHVKTDDLEAFAKGGRVMMVDSIALYTIDEILNRANRRLGEDRYNLIWNNCEHFALWCRNGEKYIV